MSRTVSQLSGIKKISVNLISYSLMIDI
jgi:hypothetical protein